MTYVFDLDGTLCETAGRSYVSATPYPQRIAYVNALHREGHTIIIDTARGSLTGEDWEHATYEQLVSWGLQFDELRTGKKIHADVYVDDKATCATDFFEGCDADTKTDEE